MEPHFDIGYGLLSGTADVTVRCCGGWQQSKHVRRFGCVLVHDRPVERARDRRGPMVIARNEGITVALRSITAFSRGLEIAVTVVGRGIHAEAIQR